MTNPPFKVRAIRRDWAHVVDLYFYSRLDDGRISTVKSVSMEVVPIDVIPPESPFSLSVTEAQSLMDELWHCGLRPSEGSGSAGSLAATEKHLKDMRAIVAKQLGVPL